MRLGIRFIHQELNLCNDLNGLRKHVPGARKCWASGLLLNKKAMALRTRRSVRAQCRFNIDPWAARWATLQPAEKQMVEIARALLFKSEV